MSYNTQYIDIHQLTKTTKKVVGRAEQMPKTTNEAQKPSKKYNKTRAEHYKDIAIFVLVTAIIAFIAGLQFANSNDAKVQAAVQALTPVVSATTEPSK